MIQQAIAICDYIPDDDLEGYLGFKKDEKLNITMFYENGWAFGHRLAAADVSGYIPINHVTLL